jgi:hypothetical protein
LEVIFEGDLGGDWSIKQVLASIASINNVHHGILRVASPEQSINGRLLVLSGRYIMGSRVSESNESGFEGARKLLSVSSGNFAYLDSSEQHPAELDQSLHISLQKLAEALPHLPENATDLFDERALLDEVFGPSPPPAPRQPEAVSAESPGGSSPVNTQQALTAWNLFKPLMVDNKHPADGQPLLLGGAANQLEPSHEGRITFGRLRAHSNKFAHERPAVFFGLILAALLVVIFLGSTLLSRYNADQTEGAPSQNGRHPGNGQ